MARPARQRARQLRRRLLSVLGTAGAVAAAAIATGSAAPAQADFEDLLDPIVQPLLTSLTDSIAIFDPAAALDLTNWTDSLLASLNASFDFLLPSTDSALAAAATTPEAALAAAPVSIPLDVLIGTEPVVNASLDGGASVPLLVDTGSAGLVVPFTQFGDNYFEQLQSLFSFGAASGFGSSGYSGGVDYFYLTYDHVPVDYLGEAGSTVLETDGPVNIEIYSFNPSNLFSLFTNDAFEKFLDANQVDGILGIGYNALGPETSPFIDYDGVLVDIPNNQLVLYGDGFDVPDSWVSTDGAPISAVLEQVNNGAQTPVTVNLDSGGVFGTIPSSLAPGNPVPLGTEITVYNASGQELYSYTTQMFNISDDGTPELMSNSPTAVSGTSINSGVIPFLNHSVYLDYTGTKGITSFSPFIP